MRTWCCFTLFKWKLLLAKKYFDNLTYISEFLSFWYVLLPSFALMTTWTQADVWPDDPCFSIIRNVSYILCAWMKARQFCSIMTTWWRKFAYFISELIVKYWKLILHISNKPWEAAHYSDLQESCGSYFTLCLKSCPSDVNFLLYKY